MIEQPESECTDEAAWTVAQCGRAVKEDGRCETEGSSSWLIYEVVSCRMFGGSAIRHLLLNPSAELCTCTSILTRSIQAYGVHRHIESLGSIVVEDSGCIAHSRFFSEAAIG